MKARMVVIGGIVAAFAGSILATAASAQGLADIARKEEERRKAMGKATATKQGKVYTNDNLNPDFTVPAPTPAAGAGASADAAAKDPTAKPAQVPDPANLGEDTGGNPNIKPININDKDEKYWRGRAATIRAAMADAQARIDAFQGRINALQNDPAELKLNVSMQQSARNELASLQTEWENFLAVAKQQNVPEAWVQ